MKYKYNRSFSIVSHNSDFSCSVRRAALDYAIQRFGRNQVFSVGNQSTLKLKTSIHDVFKAYGFPYEEIIQYTKQIPNDAEIESLSISEAIEQLPFLKPLFEKKPEAIDAINELKDKIRSIGQHAAGIVISGVDITKTLPLAKTSTDVYVTANTEGGDNHEITSLGFIKYDFLSLTAIDHMDQTAKLIKERHGIDIDWEEIHNEEEKYRDMYSLLTKGDCYGIFQFGSRLAIDYLKKMKPENLNDLCAASALLRPGPLDQKAHETYANRKNGIEKDYTVPKCLEKYLKDTFGVLAYQEQILLIVQELCSFTKEEANKFRKDLVKYEKSVEFETARIERVLKSKNRIIKAFENNGMSAEEALKWWEYIEAFSRYAFNYCLHGSSVVEFENGEKKAISKIKSSDIGKKIKCSENGTAIYKQIKKKIHSGKKKMYKIFTESGKQLICTLEHKIMTHEGMKTLKEIIEQDLEILTHTE